MRLLLPTFDDMVGEIDDYFLLNLEVDARVGGRFFALLDFVGEPGVHEGEYRVFNRPHRLVFTWHSPVLDGLETLVTMDFEGRDSEVELTLTHEGLPSRELRVRHEREWARLLERAADALDQIRAEGSEP
jgi:uncharacterized protein YndB with AHSA1/START domain